MVIKKYIHLVLSILLIPSCILSLQYTPQNTKFTFDLHKVIVAPAKNRVINGLFNRNMLPEINTELPSTLAKVAWYLPAVSYHVAQLLYEGGTGEQFYRIFKDYGYNKLAQAVITIANDQEPIQGTINYLQKYKDNKQIIFIDDKAQNVAAANQAGMIGILFTTPQQLRSDLVKMEILQKKEKQD